MPNMYDANLKKYALVEIIELWSQIAKRKLGVSFIQRP